MTALRLGEDRARSLGIAVGRLRFASLFRISLLSAAAVAFVGTIGFVGLVGPHVARLVVGEDHRFLLPTSALVGGVMLSLASSASETLVDGAVVPIGIVTSLIGVPAFLVLVLGRRGAYAVTDTGSSGTLEVRGLRAGYGRTTIIQGMDLGPIPAGQVTALVGPNAAGKSTLLRTLAGLVTTSAGSIRLFGEELVGAPAVRRATVVSFMPQSLPDRVGLSVLEGVLTSLRASPVEGLERKSVRARAFQALERVGIGHLALERLDHLSGGQRQLANLAQAIARDPRLVLLDEPTSALDMRYQLVVMDLMRRLADEGRVVVSVLHDLNLAVRWADRVVVIAEGSVRASGAPEDAVTAPLLREVYDVEGRVERCSKGSLQVIADRVGVEE